MPRSASRSSAGTGTPGTARGRTPWRRRPPPPPPPSPPPRDAVIGRLDAGPALRRSLHRRAFLALTERVRDKDDPDPSLRVRIAGHALGADRDLPAAEAAAAFLAAARAERASSEAAEAWARAGIAKIPAGQGTRASLHLALGDVLDQRRADPEADRQYQLAYDIAAGRPLDQAEALIRLARRWTDPR